MPDISLKIALILISDGNIVIDSWLVPVYSLLSFYVPICSCSK